MLMVPSTRGFVGAVPLPPSALDPNFSVPAITLSNNNLTAIGNSTTSSGSVLGTQGAASGKRYFEATFDILATTPNGLGSFVGVVNTYFTRLAYPAGLNLTFMYPGTDSYSWGFGQYQGNYMAQLIGGTPSGTAFSGSNGAVAMVAVDLDAGHLWFGMNGAWCQGSPLGTVDFSIPPGGSLGGALWPAVFVTANPNFTQVTFNPGYGPFQYGPPSGFIAWGAGDGTGAFVSTSPR
jgi:hypothetical protein